MADESSSPESGWLDFDFSEDLINICNNGNRRLLITGLLRKFLITYFSDDDHFEATALAGRVWRDDPSSPLLIESALTWTPKIAGKRPAILIKAGELKLETPTIGGMQQVTAAGTAEFMKMVTGNHLILVITPTEPETEALAAEAYRAIVQCEALLRRNLNLLRVRVTGVSAPQLSEEYNQMVVVGFGLEYGWSDNWSIEYDTEVLTTITLL